MRMRTARDDQRMNLYMLAACMLHNMCLATWKDFLSDDQLKEVMTDEYMTKKHIIDRTQFAEWDVDCQRREDIALDMVELQGPDFDVNAVDQWVCLYLSQ